MPVEQLPLYMGISFAIINTALVTLVFPTDHDWWFVVGVGLISLGGGYFGGRLGLRFFKDRRSR